MSLIYNDIDLSTLVEKDTISDKNDRLLYIGKLNNIITNSIDQFEISIIEEAGTCDVNEYIKSKDADWLKSKSKYIIDHMKSNTLVFRRYMIVFMARNTPIDYSLFTDAIFTIADISNGEIRRYILCLHHKALKSGTKHYEYLNKIYDILKYCLSSGCDMSYNAIIYRLCNIYSLGHFLWHRSTVSNCTCKNLIDAPCHKIIYDIFNLCRSYPIYDDKRKCAIQSYDLPKSIYIKYKHKYKLYIPSLIAEFGPNKFLENINNIISQPRTVIIKLPTPVKLKLLRGHMQRGCLLNKLPKDVLNVILTEADTIRNYDKKKYESPLSKFITRTITSKSKAPNKRKVPDEDI